MVRLGADAVGRALPDRRPTTIGGSFSWPPHCSPRRCCTARSTSSPCSRRRSRFGRFARAFAAARGRDPTAAAAALALSALLGAVVLLPRMEFVAAQPRTLRSQRRRFARRAAGDAARSASGGDVSLDAGASQSTRRRIAAPEAAPRSTGATSRRGDGGGWICRLTTHLRLDRRAVLRRAVRAVDRAAGRPRPRRPPQLDARAAAAEGLALSNPPACRRRRCPRPARRQRRGRHGRARGSLAPPSTSAAPEGDGLRFTVTRGDVGATRLIVRCRDVVLMDALHDRREPDAAGKRRAVPFAAPEA